MALRLVFMGTPDFAVPTLLEIVGSGHDVVAVYTRAPQPAGRGMELRRSPVAREAARFGLPVFTPKTLQDRRGGRRDARAWRRRRGGRRLRADPAASRCWMRFPLGCFNLHASLLPRWRGAAPIQRAIMAGDRETGVMVMRMEEGLDTGPVAMAERVADRPRRDRRRTARRAGAARRQADGGRARRAGARHAATHAAAGRRRHLRHQDRQDRDAHRLDASRGSKCTTIAAGCRRFPAPGSSLPDAGRIKVLRTTKGDGGGKPGTVLDERLTIACGDGAVRIVELQRAGRQPMTAEEFLRGTPVAPGSVLG